MSRSERAPNALADLLGKFRIALLEERRERLRLEEYPQGECSPLGCVIRSLGSASFKGKSTFYLMIANSMGPSVDSYRRLSTEGGGLLLSPIWSLKLGVDKVESPETLWTVFVFHFNTPEVNPDRRIIHDAIAASIWAIEKCLHEEPASAPQPGRKGGMREAAILGLLAKLKAGRGLEGKSILRKLPSDLGDIEEPTLRKHHLSPMVRRGEIKNTPGIGYHL